MNRTHFLKSFLGLGLISAWSCQTDQSTASRPTVESSAKPDSSSPYTGTLRTELKAAWARSEEMTLKNVEQMPPDLFTFKYTDEAMTFSEQWRHCVVFTCGQLANNIDIENPYADIKLPVQMPKADVIKELKKMYAFVRQSVDELSDGQLLKDCSFAGDTIPVWRLFYALENHIIHHRGQCIVYLRLSGIVPKGYYGW
ncbi:MAG: DinB family protein [Bacteroidota bacterium]